MLGAGSRLHPDAPTDQQNDCGYGALYSTFAHVMPWIERGAGFDITPCHDADGTWNPDERCSGFPLAPDDGTQSSESWVNGCATEALSGPGATCGAAFGEEPGRTTSTGGDEGGSSTGAPDPDAGESSSGGLVSGGTAADDSGEPQPEPTPTPDPDPRDMGSSGAMEDPGADSDDGCGCRSDRRGGRWQVLLALGLFGLRRRPRPN